MTRFGGWLLAASLVGTAIAAEPPIGDAETLFPQQLSADVLLTYCASSSVTHRGRQRQRYCAGFVSGVEESLRLLQMPSTQEQRPALCVPANASARQFQDAYLRYAVRPGADLERPAVLVAVDALQTAYPCPSE